MVSRGEPTWPASRGTRHHPLGTSKVPRHSVCGYMFTQQMQICSRLGGEKSVKKVNQKGGCLGGSVS